MKMAVNTQLSYYQNHKINPVFIETSGDNWTKHLRARCNLYENHLKIPVSWFNGKRILEFGPNGGENSLILAMYGGHITLVEPHQMMHERIHKLYSESSLAENLKKIDARTLENYQDNFLYDLVVAEGFICALLDRLEVIRKLCSFSSNFVIFTYVEKVGYFFESLKRGLFRRLIDIHDIDDSDWDQIIKLAQRVFFESFNKLGSARTFDSWVKDVLLNPCGTSKMFDSLEQFLSVLEELNFEYYSGSPAWDLRFAHKWYKDTTATSLKEEYHKNIPFFISGDKNECLPSECIQSISSIIDIFLDYSSGLREFSDIQTMPRLSLSDWEYANKINELLDLLSEGDPAKIITFYVESNLCDLWGMPNHYVCLRRNINLTA